MMVDLAIRSNRILTPTGFVRGVVFISEGKIISCDTDVRLHDSKVIIDVENDVVMPGLIDAHVHINEPGRTEWEGFDTATKAAAAGGITTLIDMPLNSTPVTTNFANLRVKIEAVKNNAHVNVGFYGGVIPGNLYELEKMLQGGVFGIKAFLTHSGIDDFPNVQPSELHDVLILLKKYNRPLLVHCELSEHHEGLADLQAYPTSYEAYLRSRPKSWEDNAIAAMINLCRATMSHVHIVHLSSADSLPQIKAARAEGIPLTVETAPHYLLFAAEEIADGNTLLKCAPPIREKANNEKLWKGLKSKLIDFIATDHSPAPAELKETDSGNFEKAWGGIAGLQFSLPAVWTAGDEEDITIQDLCKWMCENPARFLQLEKSKGKIENGFDADLVIWKPEKNIQPEDVKIYHRHKITPYAGVRLKGEVQQTIVNGKIVFSKNKFHELNAGKILSSI
jgi:allantoinase